MKKMNVHCIDCNPLNMSFDGVHLSEKGHKEICLENVGIYEKRILLKSC